MKRYRFHLAASFILLLLSFGVAFADARGYEGRSAVIHAGVVVLTDAVDNCGSTPGADGSRNWYALYAMDARTDLKPPGWEFLNPYAPSGATKQQACYWKVRLNALSEEQLMRYHLLLLSWDPSQVSYLTIAQRDKLRRFVDGGGVLWVEVPAGWNRRNGPFFPDIQSGMGGGTRLQVLNPDHPLLRGYYTLTSAEAAALGLGIQSRVVGFNPLELQPITGFTPARAVLAAGVYGSGRIMVSGADIAGALSAPLGTGTGARASHLLLVPANELKFAYNLVRWAGGCMNLSKDGRRANAAFDRYGAPLPEKWHDEQLTNSLPPVLYKGFVYVARGDKLLCYDGFPQRDADGDGNPDDGIPDLLPLGAEHDKVWEADVGASASTPVVILAPSQQPAIAELVVIITRNLEVRAYQAVPRDANGRLLPNGQIVWVNRDLRDNGARTPALLPNGTPVTPVYAEGILLIPTIGVQAGGSSTVRVYALLADTGQLIYSTVDPSGQYLYWMQPQRNASYFASTWRTQIALGYVPNKMQGGGVDLVGYFGVEGGTPVNQRGVQSLWIAAKGELLIPEQGDPNQGYTGFTSRAGSRGVRIFDPAQTNPAYRLRPRLYAFDHLTGAFIGELTDRAQFNVPTAGKITFNPAIPSNWDIYLDYYLDWWIPNITGGVLRSFLSIPVDPTGGNANPNQNDLVGLTLAPNGVLYLATGTPTSNAPSGAQPNGNLIAVQEQWSDGRTGGSRILWRWQAHSGYVQRIGGAFDQAVSATQIWNDQSLLFKSCEPQDNRSCDLRGFFNFGTNNFMSFTLTQPPLYSDGVVYVVGQGNCTIFGFPIPYTVVLAFNANPAILEVKLGAPIANPNITTVLQQVDYARKTGTNYLLNRLTYNPSTGSKLIDVHYETGVIRIKAFQEARGDRLDLFQDVLSISQPMEVNLGGQSLFVDPDQFGLTGSWSNLLWFLVLPVNEAQGPPILLGDILYLPMRSIIFDPNGNRRQFTFGAGVFAMSANPKRELPNLARGGQVGLLTPMVLRWPSLKDLPTCINFNQYTSCQDFAEDYFSELMTRMRNNAVLGQSAKPLAFGDGLLLASGTLGLFAYERQFTLVADNGRLLELDSESNVTWTAENSNLLGAIGTSGEPVVVTTKTALSQSAKVYRVGPSEILAVDTGNDRVLLLDRAGTERRVIKAFIPDKLEQRNASGQIIGILEMRQSDKPTGWVGGDPITLRAPSDATTWIEYVPNSVNPFVVQSTTGLELWVHYLIADTGNYRLVDVVDRYEVDPATFAVGNVVIDNRDPNNPIRQLSMLNWITPTSKEGRTYRYLGVQRFLYGISNGVPVYGFASIVQNYRAGTSGGGAIEQQNPEEGMIIFQVNHPTQGMKLSYCRRMTIPWQNNRKQPILNPVSISVTPVGSRTIGGETVMDIRVMIAEETGVYELQPDLNNPYADEWQVTWAVPQEVYSASIRRKLKGKDLAQGAPPIIFKPTQAKRLLHGSVLIVNSYVGSTRVQTDSGATEPVEFFGEVLELNANDFNPNRPYLGFDNGSILWSSFDRPGLTGSYTLRMPTSADR